MMNQLRSWMIQKIHRRRHAYRALFQAGGTLTPAAQIVLMDLRSFCRATTSTTVVSPTSGMVDPIASAQAEGRREVFLRITQHLHIDDRDIYRMVDNDAPPGTDQ